MGLLLLLLPLTGVLLFALPVKKAVMDLVNILVSLALLLVGYILTGDVLKYGNVSCSLPGIFFYIDALSIIVLDIVFLIGFLTAVYSVGYLAEELKHKRFSPKKIKIYYILMYTFIFTIILALTVRNMGIMWVAIEATTLASAFLVGFYNNKQAIEAAWKYITLCSVGIAVALLGIVFLYLSYSGLHDSGSMLDWTSLYNNAKDLDTELLKFAFIFILIGFGTKAGLAPMHTWLPDAHSQAPSPISAMLSGVLLNTAMYAVIRVVSILNKSLGSSTYSGRLLITFGLLSVATAAVCIITQKDYKRLLAYSSIEHMGIIALSIGIFTPAAVFAAIYHMINHSLTKSMLFFSAGSINLRYGTREISKINGVLKALPVSGTAMLLGLFAIGGTPPFSVFSSELGIMAAAFQKREFLLGGSVIVLLAVVFGGIALAAFKMFYPGSKGSDVPSGKPNLYMIFGIVVLLITITVTGLYIPDELKLLITSAQKIIVGG